MRKEIKVSNKVYVVSRPRENKFGWTPDLTDAARYGTLEVVFESNDKPAGKSGDVSQVASSPS